MGRAVVTYQAAGFRIPAGSHGFPCCEGCAHGGRDMGPCGRDAVWSVYEAGPHFRSTSFYCEQHLPTELRAQVSVPVR